MKRKMVKRVPHRGGHSSSYRQCALHSLMYLHVHPFTGLYFPTMQKEQTRFLLMFQLHTHFAFCFPFTSGILSQPVISSRFPSHWCCQLGSPFLVEVPRIQPRGASALKYSCLRRQHFLLEINQACTPQTQPPLRRLGSCSSVFANNQLTFIHMKI